METDCKLTVPKETSHTVVSISVFGCSCVDDRREPVKMYSFLYENVLVWAGKINETKTCGVVENTLRRFR